MHEHKSLTLEAGNKGCVGDRDDLERKEGREESLQRGMPWTKLAELGPRGSPVKDSRRLCVTFGFK